MWISMHYTIIQSLEFSVSTVFALPFYTHFLVTVLDKHINDIICLSSLSNFVGPTILLYFNIITIFTWKHNNHFPSKFFLGQSRHFPFKYSFFKTFSTISSISSLHPTLQIYHQKNSLKKYNVLSFANWCPTILLLYAYILYASFALVPISTFKI